MTYNVYPVQYVTVYICLRYSHTFLFIFYDIPYSTTSHIYYTTSTLHIYTTGELIGGSQREDSLGHLKAKMGEFGLKEEDYYWYNYGVV